jgi:hypothetical protein
VFSDSSGGWRTKVKETMEVVSPEASLFDWQITLDGCPHDFSLFLDIPGASFSKRCQSYWFRTHFYESFKFNDLSEGLTSYYRHKNSRRKKSRISLILG